MTDKTPAMPELPDGATVLPDGSAFALASFPLPANHWLYAPREYRDGEEDPIELPPPILSHQVHGDIVRAAIRYAVRSATMRGKEPDFDPDALVQNAMYALCGPFGGAALQSAQPAAPSCVFGAVPLRPGDTLGPQTAACLTCGQPPACLSHPAESDRQQGLSITGAQPAAAVSDEEIDRIYDRMFPARLFHEEQVKVRKFARAILALRPQADHPDTARCIKARNDLNAALHGEGALIDDLEHAVANVCAKLLRQAISLMPVTSNQVASVGYSHETKTLAVTFTRGAGNVYEYPDVEPETACAFFMAESLGRHFGQHISKLPSRKYSPDAEAVTA